MALEGLIADGPTGRSSLPKGGPLEDELAWAEVRWPWRKDGEMRQRAVLKGYLAPEEERIVFCLPDDFLLEPVESPIPFAVQQGHVDAKNAKQTVGLILDPARPLRGCP